MISDDLYSVWKKRRSQVDVDSRFADRVMERIGPCELPQRLRAVAVVRRRRHRLAWRLQLATAVFIVGLGIGLIRSSSIIIFLLLCASRGY